MDRTALLDALSRLRTARDAARLFTLLGYGPDDQPTDDETHIVARWRGFLIHAIWAPDPGPAARTLARGLALASRRGLALACGPTEIALAAPRIGAAGATPALVVPRANPPPLTLQLLQELAPRRSDTGLAHALRVADVLSTERAGERFFRIFHAVLERMAGGLSRCGTTLDRRAAALIALTRVLFLYFVQAKGWLDGRTDYLPSLLDDSLARRRDFHRDILHPLFFGTLNRPPSRRSRRLRLGQIPYLNGGLFQPHPVERRLGTVHFPNGLWRDAFDQLFQRFRFCVREADEVNAVAPDMLGRVFERVMDDDERHLTGTFYTPETVVRQVVDAAIETALAGLPGIDLGSASRIVAGTVTEGPVTVTALAALRRLRVLDPAVGSGAFLLGALQRLTDMRTSLEGVTDAAARCRLRREILRSNLFGVDLSPVAVRLAELRLWLAVVADDPTTDIRAVHPLPNLNGVLRQGDSLFDPVAATAALARDRAGSQQAARAVAAARARMFDSRGDRHARLVERLRSVELDLAEKLLTQSLRATARGLRDLAAVAAGRDLFGRRSGLGAPELHRYRVLRRQRAALRRATHALADGVVPFFCFDVHLPEIMRAGGFSVVLGNPPWVRAERLPSAERHALADRFSWWRPARERGYAHLPDLSVAFLQRSFELAAPGGAVALLTPSKLATAGYGEAARAHLVREATITYLHRVPERETASFGATTYPLAVVAKKQTPARHHAVRLGFDAGEEIPQRALDAAGPWILVPDRPRAAMERFLSGGAPLSTVAPPALGVKTGADGIFVGAVHSVSGLLALVTLDGDRIEIEEALLRPAVQGRDVKAFRAAAGRALVWAYDRAGPLARLPPRAAAYFAERAQRLSRRADYRHGPPWTLFRTTSSVSGGRVVWPDIARRPMAVLLDATSLSHAVPLNTCYLARAPERRTALAISAVFNSTWAWAVVACTADEARGGYRRINARVAGRLPVPPPGTARDALAQLAEQAHVRGNASQDDLDDAVADALGLSPSDRDALRRLVADHG